VECERLVPTVGHQRGLLLGLGSAAIATILLAFCFSPPLSAEELRIEQASLEDAYLALTTQDGASNDTEAKGH